MVVSAGRMIMHGKEVSYAYGLWSLVIVNEGEQI